MDGICSHREYYAQFVTSQTTHYVARQIGVEKIKASTDPHLNDIPIAKWDSIPHYLDGSKLKEAGDYLTDAGWVCIAKEAARQLVEEDLAKEIVTKESSLIKVVRKVIDKITEGEEY